MKMVYSPDPSSSKRPENLTRVSLAAVASLPTLRARVARFSSPGFSTHPRLVFALAAREIPAFVNAARQVDELRPQLTVPRCPSLPRHVGALCFADALVVDVIALPIEPTFAPLWGLALSGAIALVSLRHDASAALLMQTCADAQLPFLDARTLVTPLDISSAMGVAHVFAGVLSSVELA